MPPQSVSLEQVPKRFIVEAVVHRFCGSVVPFSRYVVGAIGCPMTTGAQLGGPAGASSPRASFTYASTSFSMVAPLGALPQSLPAAAFAAAAVNLSVQPWSFTVSAGTFFATPLA